MIRQVLILGAVCCVTAAAQDFLRNLDLKSLTAKAEDTVEVNLDGNLLQIAVKFLGDRGEEAQVKQLLRDLKGIHVRVFKFAKEGEYSMADVEQIRSHVAGTGWSRVVDVRSPKRENAGVYIKTDGNQIQGVVVLAAEPKELTVVSLDGSIDPARIRELGGKLGIPDLNLAPKGAPKPKESKGKGTDDE